MKTPIFLLVKLSFVCSFLIFGKLSAQILQGSEAVRLIPEAELIWINEKDGAIKFVRFNSEVTISLAEGENWLQTTLNPRPQDQHHRYESRKDALGMEHHRYQQYYSGIPVLFGVFYLHYQDNRLYAANGEHYRDIELDPQPLVKENQALGIAQSSLQAQVFGWEPDTANPEGELFVVADSAGIYHLAYRFDLKVAKPFGRFYVLIDAHSGKLLQTLDRIHTSGVDGLAETKYRGTRTMQTDSLGPASFRLRDDSRGSGVETYDLNSSTDYNSAVDFTDEDNYWDDTLNQDDAAYDCHWGTQQTYDYFLEEHGLNSYDGNGASLKSYVHYKNNYLNAFWNGSFMSYGDGDGAYVSALTSLVIVCHEITHGITENSAGLIYAFESGALNESFSDIFGIALDFYVDPTHANWLSGEEIGFPSRNPSYPNQFSDPDTYLGLFWSTSFLDNGGVHTNSGVQNYWFYLLSEGGSGINDNGDSYQVAGVGIAKAAEIAFRNLTVYLTPNSQYADARFYAIEAAKDLFGPCSLEHISTENAWYAVGVGLEYDPAVTADFAVSQAFSCAFPTTIDFVNLSLNGTSYVWDFGDGDTSSQVSPSHTYLNPGIYTVSLIVDGQAACGNSDTLILQDLIEISGIGEPIPATCTPASPYGGYNGAGIYQFNFHTIHRTSPNGIDGYQDYSCEEFTEVAEGLAYPVTITTSPDIPEDVRIWIDVNNDGMFDSTELVFASLGILQYHQGTIIIPGGGVTNSILRMRVGSDESGSHLQACDQPNLGQFEDYSLSILANNQAPIAAFAANNLIVNPGQPISFADSSLYVPNSWEWDFPGGSPATSTSQHPTVAYSSPGTYPVTLKVTNSFGVDSLTKTAYVKVTNVFWLCQSYTTSADSGYFYDSGGPNGPYSQFENCSFLIQRSCSEQITLTFTELHLLSIYDILAIYDGNSTAGPLLFAGSGPGLPPTVTATSGTMLIRFFSYQSDQGWVAYWHSTPVATGPPTANFGIPLGPLPINAPIPFTDQTTDNPVSWLWDFGDGTIDSNQHPVHHFSSPGTYTVSLIADNCVGIDTVSQVISISDGPTVGVLPDSLSVSFATCDDSTTETLLITNQGTGPLLYDINVSIPEGSPALLFDDFEDQDLADWNNSGGFDLSTSSADPIQGDYCLKINGTGNIVQGVSRTFNSDSVPEISFYIKPSVSTLNQGQIMIGDSIINHNYALFSLGFRDNGTIRLATSSQLSEVPFAPNQWYHFEFKSIDFTAKTFDYYINDSLIESNFPFYSSNISGVSWIKFQNSHPVAVVYYDHIRIGKTMLETDWVHVSPDSAMVMPGDTAFLLVQVDGEGFPGGLHQRSLEITTNDASLPLVVVPVTMEITGSAELAMSDTCMDMGFTPQYTGITDSVVIGNPGCDTLKITISSTHPAFAPEDPTLFILPGHSSPLYVEFFPDTIGTYQGLLYLSTNAGDSSICLSGIATAAPILEVEPDTLVASVSCGGSVVLDLAIVNQGLGNASISQIAIKHLADTSILLIQNHPTWSMDMDTFLQNQYGITPTVIPDNQISQTNLEEYDLVITAGGQSNLFCWRVSQALSQFESYAQQGGVIQYQGAVSSGGMNLPAGVWLTGGLPESLNDNLLPSHPLMAGLPPILAEPSVSYSWLSALPPNAEVLTRISGNPLPTTAVYPYGNGTIIATGMMWEYMYQYDQIPGRMLFNSVEFALGLQAQALSWISPQPAGGLINSGDSLVVTISLNADGLEAGTYETAIDIHSDDPLTPVISIPVSFTVTGEAAMDFSSPCLDFPAVIQSQLASDSVWLTNTGCDTLELVPFITSGSPFSTSSTAFLLPPGDSMAFPVDFTSQTLGSFTDSLQVFTNVGIETICLTAESIGPPSISAIPSPYDRTIWNCHDSVFLFSTIYNHGFGPLIFEAVAQLAPFDSSNSQHYTSLNAQTTHSFSGWNQGTTAAMLVVTLNGDFNNSNEFADIYLDSTYLGSLGSGYQVTGVDVVDTIMIDGTNWTQASADGSIEIIIQNSGGVDLGGANLHQARLLVAETDWGNIHPSQGILPAGDSLTLVAEFEVSNLAPGPYLFRALIRSNDTAQPSYEVPFRVEITEEAILAFADSGCVDFSETRISQSVAQSLTLYNRGCVPLELSTLGTTSSSFSVSLSNLLIQAEDSANIELTFSPVLIGPDQADLLINGPTGDTTICLRGIGSPSVSIDPDWDTRALTFYPNPNRGSFWVEYQAQNVEASLEITNVLGQLIQREQVTKAEIRHHLIQLPSNIATGTYFLKILDGDIQVSGRLLVEK